MSKYKVNEIELFLDGENKKFKKGRVSGGVLLKIVNLRAGMQRFQKKATEELKKEGYSGDELNSELEFRIISEYDFLTKASAIVAETFGNQFSAEDFINGTEAHELSDKVGFYFENGISNGESVGDDTEDFLEEEQEKETE